MKKNMSIFFIMLFLQATLSTSIYAKELYVENNFDSKIPTDSYNNFYNKTSYDVLYFDPPTSSSTTTTTIPTTLPASSTTRTSVTCNMSTLTPKEVEAIKRELRMNPNARGKNVTSSDGNNTPVQNLTRSNAVAANLENGSAIQMKLPSEKMSAQRLSPLLNHISKGAFAYGIILNDTFRLGRCSDELKKEFSCPVDNKGLRLRNSGTGMKAIVKNAWKTLEIEELFNDKNGVFGDLTAEEKKNTKARLLEEKYMDVNSGGDANSPIKLKSVQRDNNTEIKNVIETNKFNIKMSSNTKHGYISTYSMYDKYYNSAFSTQLVAQTAGPVLLHRTKRLLGISKSRLQEYWPFKGNSKISQLTKKVNAKFFKSGSFLGSIREQRLEARFTKYPEIRDLHFQMVMGNGGDSGYKVVKGAGFRYWLGKAMKDDGLIGSIKSPKVREEWLKHIGDMKHILNTYNDIYTVANVTKKKALSLLDAQLARGTLNAAKHKSLVDAAEVAEGKVIAQIMQDMDNKLLIDTPELMMRNSHLGWMTKGVKNTQSGEILRLNAESSFADEALFNPFIKKGSWAGNGKFENVGEKLQLYDLRPFAKRPGGGIDKANIDSLIAEAKTTNIATRLKNGSFVQIDDATKSTIMENGPASLEIFDVGPESWQKVEPLGAIDFSSRIKDTYMHGRNTFLGGKNMELFEQTLLQNPKFSGRRYTSVLDKILAQEPQLIKQYFTIPGALKFTALPYGYWWMKRGVGIREYSAYQLPKEWTEIEMYLGQSNRFNDSFVDFFANEGSDQGDLFTKMLNALPIKSLVLDNISEHFNPVHDTYEYVTGTTRRDIVENIVFYVYGPRNCSTCSLVIDSRTGKEFIPNFVATEKLTGFVLEEKTQASEETGQLLVLYGHHVNLHGKSLTPSDKPEDIDLEKAVRNDSVTTDSDKLLTCSEISKHLGLGIVQGKKIGGVYVIGESLLFYAVGMYALVPSIAYQMAYLGKLRDCVDTEEGYFVHMFVPKVENRKSGKADPLVKGTEKLADFLDKAKETAQAALVGSANSAAGQAMQKVGESIDKFNNTIKDSQIVEAQFFTEGYSSGHQFSEKFTYLWLQGGFELHKSGYVNTGSTNIIGDNNTSTKIDYTAGTISINNASGTRNIINNPNSKDHVRMLSVNGKGPFMSVPQKLGKVGLTGSKDKVFEINSRGETKVLDSAILDCIKSSVKEQTGLDLTSDELSEAFGAAETVITNTHAQITIDRTGLSGSRKILAEGTPRRSFGEDSKVFIYGNADVNISESSILFDAGKLKSIQFENGSIVFKANTMELLVHLRHHANGVINKEIVKNMKAELASVKNPDTNCEEDAFKLEVRADPSSRLETQKAENFSKSLAKLGPFQVFETAEKVFIFYSKLINGECQRRFRIIDKNTGEIYDKAIDGSIRKTEDGFEFETSDGQKHKMDFSSENGVPTITYNGEKSAIRNAQGPNGAFWYDPETGKWYVENAQLLPLLEAFKQRGIEFKGDGNGTVIGGPSNNIFIGEGGLQGGAGGNPLANLPSMPKNPILMLLMILSMVGTMFVMWNSKK